MLPRVLEPEAMDTPEEAVDYDAMDHGGANRAFVDDLLAAGLEAGLAVDLGTGTAQIPIELCRRRGDVRVLAGDRAGHMLAVARRNVDAAGLGGRIELAQVDAKRLPYAAGQFRTVFSNSLLHHLANPAAALREIWRVLAPGGLAFVRDLFRPADEVTLRRLVDRYTVGENAHQRAMFEDSLRASLSVDEIAQLAADLGVNPARVQATSDRHWTWTQKKGFTQSASPRATLHHGR